MFSNKILFFLFNFIYIKAQLSESNLYPYGALNEDYVLRKGDDEIEVFTQPCKIPFYGQTDKYVAVDTNGLLTFFSEEFNSEIHKSFRPSSSANFTSFRGIMLYWTDIDTRFTDGNIYIRSNKHFKLLKKISNDISSLIQTSFYPNCALIVTYDNVPTYGNPTKRLTFQVAIATDGNDTYAIMNYDKLVYSDKVAVAGFSNGNGIQYYLLPGSLNDTIIELADTSNIPSLRGRWIFKIDSVPELPPLKEIRTTNIIEQNSKGNLIDDTTKIIKNDQTSTSNTPNLCTQQLQQIAPLKSYELLYIILMCVVIILILLVLLITIAIFFITCKRYTSDKKAAQQTNTYHNEYQHIEGAANNNATHPIEMSNLNEQDKKNNSNETQNYHVIENY